MENFKYAILTSIVLVTMKLVLLTVVAIVMVIMKRKETNLKDAVHEAVDTVSPAVVDLIRNIGTDEIDGEEVEKPKNLARVYRESSDSDTLPKSELASEYETVDTQSHSSDSEVSSLEKHMSD